MRKILSLLLGILCLVFSSCCYHTDGPFKGKVVELETEKPIEGAVVAATWNINVLFDYSQFCDAVETVTDKDGEFVLPSGGCWNHPLARMYDAEVVVFKPGYLSFPPINIMNSPFNGTEFTHRDQYYTIKLGRPKTREEREITYGHSESPFTFDETYKKLPVLLKLSNEERKNLGFSGEIGRPKR